MSLLVALGAGLLSFLSPCVLPLVPVYLASLAGPEIFTTDRHRTPIFLHSLSFVIGFTLIFTALGVSVGLIGFATSSSLMHQIAGSLLIAFGLFMLAALKIPWLNYEKRLAPNAGATTGYLRSFLLGAVFSLAWTPCVGPILGGILTLAWSSETAWQGGYLLIAYSLGLGLPFLVIGVAFDSLMPLLKRIRTYSNLIYIFSGMLLIVMGVLIFTNNLAIFL